jgi:glycerate 2-kinase
MISAEAFLTESLRRSPQGQAIARILAAAVNAADPAEALRRQVTRAGDVLNVAGERYDLNAFRGVYLLAMGKAALPMAEALTALLGERLTGGLAITKHAPIHSRLPFPLLEGDHPLPGRRSLEAGARAAAFLSALGREDLLFCLISGGGSALAAAPIEGVSLEDLQALTAALLACGARIDEINALRRRLERLKGGGVVNLANGARTVGLILSDVVGSPLEAIASGPTAPDPTTRRQALAILSRYDLQGRIPASISKALRSAPETPKPGDPRWRRVQNVIVGSNLLAAQAALKQAEAEGFHPYLLRADLQGEARQAAFELATLLRQARQTGQPAPLPACLVAGGETTVTVRGNGQGGRNTELALAAVTELAGFPGVILAALATDGEDGPTDAAGAVVDGGTFRRAAALGLHPVEYLERNDSYSFFAALGDLLKPGPTGTNVNDLIFLFTLAA